VRPAARWKVLAALLLGAALLAMVARSGADAAGDDPYGIPGVDYVDGRVLVAFQPGTPAAVEAAAHARAGGRVERVIPGINVRVVDVGRGRVAAAVAAYRRSSNVRFAEPDLIVHAAVDCPSGSGTFANDPCTWRQWGLNNTGQNWGEGTGLADADVDVPEAWNADARGSGVLIAVLDTGYDTTHKDLAGRVAASQDFTGTGIIEDRNGHGTWTASIAAAATGNGIGIAGVAPDATLIVGKVLGDDGSGSWSQVAQGITWAADYGTQNGLRTVISMSLGGQCYRGKLFLCQTLKDAVQSAASNGALLVAAAGNSGSAKTEYPGAFGEVLAVAATDDHDQVASFSNRGDVAAPGVAVFGAFPDCDNGSTFRLHSRGIECSYDYGSGTSAATPVAAGVAALVWSGARGASAAVVRGALESAAQDIPGTDFDGAGRITACGALVGVGVQCTEQDSSQPPLASPYDVQLEGSATSSGRTWSATVTVTITMDGQPAAGVQVVGSWSTGTEGSCTTDNSSGTCSVELSAIPKRTASVTFTVTSVGGSTSFTGDTAITVTKP